MVLMAERVHWLSVRSPVNCRWNSVETKNHTAAHTLRILRKQQLFPGRLQAYLPLVLPLQPAAQRAGSMRRGCRTGSGVRHPQFFMRARQQLCVAASDGGQQPNGIHDSMHLLHPAVPMCGEVRVLHNVRPPIQRMNGNKAPCWSDLI